MLLSFSVKLQRVLFGTGRLMGILLCGFFCLSLSLKHYLGY